MDRYVPPRANLFAIALTTVLAGLHAWWVTTQSRADFGTLWAALQSAEPYGPVNFPYPPSSLPIFQPFALLDFAPAMILWVSLSACALAISTGSRWVPLLLLAPPVLWALPSGQTSVLMGALIFGGLRLLRKPVAAGFMFGLVLTVKPQLMTVLLAGLLLSGHWRILFCTGATFAAMTVLSGAIFGFGQWLSWFDVLSRFTEFHETNAAYRRNEIAFGIPWPLRIAALIAGAILVAKAIERRDAVELIVIAVGFALIASPHAMGYEFAVVSPAFIWLIARRRWAAPATVVFMSTTVLVWSSGGALRSFSPYLWTLLILIMAVVVDGDLRRRSHAVEASLGKGVPNQEA